MPAEKTTHTIAKAQSSISVHSLLPPVVYLTMNSIIFLKPCTIFRSIETLLRSREASMSAPRHFKPDST